MKTPHQIRAALVSAALEIEATASELTFGKISLGDGTARISRNSERIRQLAAEVNELAIREPSHHQTQAR